MQISWDEIQTVEALVRTGSIEAAGRELSLHPSSVSRRISAMEERLGAALFVRGARLVATPLATQIALRAGPMRVEATKVTELLAAELQDQPRTLMMTTNDALAPLLFAGLSTLDLTREVEVIITDEKLELLPGVVDLALRPTQTPNRALRGRRLGCLATGVYIAPNGRDNWILPSASLRSRKSMRWWKHVPHSFPAALYCDSLLAMRDACRCGLGRAALPCILARNDERLHLERTIDGGSPLWLLRPASRDGSTRSKTIANALFRALRSTEGAFAAS